MPSKIVLIQAAGLLRVKVLVNNDLQDPLLAPKTEVCNNMNSTLTCQATPTLSESNAPKTTVKHRDSRKQRMSP